MDLFMVVFASIGLVSTAVLLVLLVYAIQDWVSSTNRFVQHHAVDHPAAWRLDSIGTQLGFLTRRIDDLEKKAKK